MSKQITVTLPDGYEEPYAFVVVSIEGTGWRRGSVEYAAAVLAAGETTPMIEELGIDTSLNRLMTDAAKSIRVFGDTPVPEGV